MFNWRWKGVESQSAETMTVATSCAAAPLLCQCYHQLPCKALKWDLDLFCEVHASDKLCLHCTIICLDISDVSQQMSSERRSPLESNVHRQAVPSSWCSKFTLKKFERQEDSTLRPCLWKVYQNLELSLCRSWMTCLAFLQQLNSNQSRPSWAFSRDCSHTELLIELACQSHLA